MTAAKYIRYALKEILEAQTSFCQITKGVRYAPIIPSMRITFDFRSDAKKATARVNTKAVRSVATSGMIACTDSDAREPYMSVP